MRIYCDLCDKVQPVQIDDCKDVKTGELYQDIVCGECDLVITSGTGIKRTWVDLTDEEVVFLKMLGRDLEFVSMTGLRRFARDIAQTLKEKNT